MPSVDYSGTERRLEKLEMANIAQAARKDVAELELKMKTRPSRLELELPIGEIDDEEVAIEIVAGRGCKDGLHLSALWGGTAVADVSLVVEDGKLLLVFCIEGQGQTIQLA